MGERTGRNGTCGRVPRICMMKFAAWCGAVVAAVILPATHTGAISHARDHAEQAHACSRVTGPAGIAPAQWKAGTGASALERTGMGQLRFRGKDGNELPLHVYRPASFDARVGPIWFVMHGRGRDGSRYAREAAPSAEQYGALVLAIEFPSHSYPTGESYTLGVVSRGRANESAMKEGRWRKPGDYLYNEVERTFEAVRSHIGGTQRGYFIYGHSAGAQFTHRLVTFVPCARVLGAVAANAGWYTLPDFDGRHAMPYSLRATPLSKAEQRAALAAPLTLLLGTEDTRTAHEDDDVRATPGALDQGPDRLSRGRNYFETGRRVAEKLQIPFGWRLELAPGAGHANAHVIASAARLLFAPPGEPLCQPDAMPAPGAVVLTRASPDAPVEIANNGARDVCLAGWSIQVQGSRKRHVFPIGPALAAGETRALREDGLPADEGVLILRDSNGQVAARLARGECGRPCARTRPSPNQPRRTA